jgi:hypothetical protein
MRNDEGHQVYFKASDIIREFFGDKKSGNIPDVQDRMATAIAEGLSKKKYQKKAWEIGFHLMDWHSDANFLLALSYFPERFTDAEIRQGVIWFLIHAGYHIPEAARLIDIPTRSHFRDKFRERKAARKRKGKRS